MVIRMVKVRVMGCIIIRLGLWLWFELTPPKTPILTLDPNPHNLIVENRFNKIATQGAPQMAVDKEANSLSRV